MSEGVQQIGQKIAEQFQRETSELNAKIDHVDEDVVSQFEQAMNENKVNTKEEGSVSGNIQETQNIEQEGLGDQILKGIEKLKQSHEQQIEKVNQLVENSDDQPMSVQEALRLQFELMQLSQEQELVSKGADKSSQAVQTMFRNQ
ncbi:EscI/YscI/HrpB family type III secretion system inner rod protein [Desulfothermus sp.]